MLFSAYFQYSYTARNSNVLAQGFASVRLSTYMDFSNDYMQMYVPVATGKPSCGICIGVAMN
jgi:hypothetical protein